MFSGLTAKLSTKGGFIHIIQNLFLIHDGKSDILVCMREIVLDTETTGLDPDAGDRIVEIGCVELENHQPTGKTYHQ